MDEKVSSSRLTPANHRAAHRRQFYLWALIAVSLGIFLSESTGAWPFPAAQNHGRVFEKSRDPRPKPVELVELRAANKVVKLGERFESEQDWLNGIAFKVRNSSGKEIVYLELDLNFPETANAGNEMSFPIKLGRRPGASTVLREPLSAKPGAELVVELDENKYRELARFVETRRAISDIHKVRPEIGFVVFSDGTAWGAGSYLRQDPKDPNHYINTGDTPPNQ